MVPKNGAAAVQLSDSFSHALSLHIYLFCRNLNKITVFFHFSLKAQEVHLALMVSKACQAWKEDQESKESKENLAYLGLGVIKAHRVHEALKVFAYEWVQRLLFTYRELFCKGALTKMTHFRHSLAQTFLHLFHTWASGWEAWIWGSREGCFFVNLEHGQNGGGHSTEFECTSRHMQNSTEFFSGRCKTLWGKDSDFASR